MPISIVCPTCNRRIRGPEEAMGHNVRCPGCGNHFVITLDCVVRRDAATRPPPVLAQPAKLQPAQREAEKQEPARLEPANPQLAEGKLRPCPDCNREVSRRAAQCPHCGCPLATAADDKRSPFEAVFSAFILAIREGDNVIDSIDKPNGSIVFQSKGSWFTPGQVFSFVIIDNGDGTCSGDARNFHAGLFDLGVGREIIQRVTSRALKVLEEQGLGKCFR